MELNFLVQEGMNASTSANAKDFGLLIPPLAVPCNSNMYRIVSGIKDVLIAQRLQVEELTCRVLPEDTPPIRLFRLQAQYLQLQQPSIVEQSLLLNKASKFLSTEELCSLLPLMGYKPQLFKAKSILQLLEMDAAVLHALHCGVVSLKTASKLSSLDNEDRRDIIRLITSYRLGGSKQLKLVEMVIELVKREQTSLKQLLEGWHSSTATKDKENLPQQATTLLSHLYRKGHPLLMAEEDSFTRWSQSLQLPESTRVSHSQAFEDETVELSIRFASRDNLEACWEKIQQTVKEKSIKGH